MKTDEEWRRGVFYYGASILAWLTFITAIACTIIGVWSTDGDRWLGTGFVLVLPTLAFAITAAEINVERRGD